MKWNKISFNPDIRFDIQETLPKVGMPIVYIKPGKDERLNDYQIGRLLLDRNECPKIGFYYNEGIDGIWWSYLDSIPEDVETPEDIIIGIHQVYKFGLNPDCYPESNYFEGQRLMEQNK